jgi:heme/copper-type cytochrome/quinol oxidase subunit 3
VFSGIIAWLTFRDWSAYGMDPRASAYDSTFIALLSFEWLQVLVLAVLLAASIAWAWIRPADPRGHSIALISELQGYFVAASWVVIYAVLYLTPRFW